MKWSLEYESVGLHYLQKTVEKLLKQEDHSLKARHDWEQRMRRAQEEETLARQEIEALMRKLED